MITLLYYTQEYDPVAIHIYFEGEDNALNLFKDITSALDIEGRVYEMKLKDHFSLLHDALKNQTGEMNAFPTLHLFIAQKSTEFDIILYGLGMDELLGAYPRHIKANDQDYPKIEQLYYNMLPRRKNNCEVQAKALGLKVEGPFMDDELINFCKKMPRDFKMNAFKTKLILRDLMKGRLPESNRLNGLIVQTKGGFHPPIKNWWNDGLDTWVHDKLNLFDEIKTGRNLWKKIIHANEKERMKLLK